MLQEGYQERGRALGGKSVGASEGLDRGRKSRSVASLCSQCMFQKSEGGGGGAALQRASTAWAWAERKVQVEVNRKHRVERCFFGAQASLARTRGCTVEVLVPHVAMQRLGEAGPQAAPRRRLQRWRLPGWVHRIQRIPLCTRGR